MDEDKPDHDEELRLLREATDEVKRAAEELARTNEVLRIRLERMEAIERV